MIIAIHIDQRAIRRFINLHHLSFYMFADKRNVVNNLETI